MSSLLGLLDLGAGAIQAQNAGIATAANNAANVNTEGYSRQRVDLESNPGSPLYGGVRFGDPQRHASELLAGRQRLAEGSTGYFSTMSATLLDLESMIASAQQDIPEGLANLFGSINNLGAAPLDPLTRDALVTDAERLGTTLNQHADEIERAREGADDRVRDRVDEASALMQEIAKLNSAINGSADPVLLDKREHAAMKLAEIVGGKARVDDDGHMRFLLDNGSVLVDGTRASSLEAVPGAAASGFSRIDIVDGNHRRDVTQALSSGALGADLQFRDTIGAALAQDIDQFAFDLATNLNAVHRGFEGLDAVSGRDFFVEPAAVQGAAKAFALDPGIKADPNTIASAAVGAPVGNSDGMLALLDLQDQQIAGAGTRTLIDESVRFLSGLGQQVRSAEIDLDFHSAQRESLAALRDSVSGVSIEEEMNRLSQFQHASEANMRFVQTIYQLLGSLIDRL